MYIVGMEYMGGEGFESHCFGRWFSFCFCMMRSELGIRYKTRVRNALSSTLMEPSFAKKT
jgi:hypothetical protein